MMSYATIEDLPKEPTIINNEDFVINISFFIILHFMSLVSMFYLVMCQ